MTAVWELWISDPVGNRLALLDRTGGFEIAKSINDPGWFKVRLPEDFDRLLIGGIHCLDRQVEFWRAPTETDKLMLEFLGFLRHWTYETDDNGLTTITIAGPSITDLLKRRIVAYAASSAETDKTGTVDDVMKEIVYENLGAGAIASRDLSGLGFTIQPDLSAAPAVQKKFAWQKVWSVLQALSDSAWGNGLLTGFEIVPITATHFEFRTWVGQPGKDRTTTGEVAPIIFGLEFRNLERPKLVYDYSEEENAIYCGGEGEGAERIIQGVWSDARIGMSVWNRREGFADARMEGEPAAVEDAGYARLSKYKPRQHFTGRLLDTPGTRYGQHWHFGDRVTVTYLEEQFDVLVSPVKLKVDGNGKETVDVRVRYDQ